MSKNTMRRRNAEIWIINVCAFLLMTAPALLMTIEVAGDRLIDDPGIQFNWYIIIWIFCIFMNMLWFSVFDPRRVSWTRKPEFCLGAGAVILFHMFWMLLLIQDPLWPSLYVGAVGPGFTAAILHLMEKE